MSKAKITKAKQPAKKVAVKAKKQPTLASRETSVKVVRFDPKPQRKGTVMQTQNFEKATQSMMQAYEEINSTAKAFGEATLQSANAMTKGLEEITRSASGMLQETMANSLNAGKSLMGSKSIQEAIALQQEMAKDFFDRWVAGAGKITEISARVGKEVSEPVAQQVNSAVSKIMSKAKMAA